MFTSLIALLLQAVGTAAAPVSTRDHYVETHGAMKVVWDDTWFEAEGDKVWLYQRLSYGGDWRFYDRASIAGIFDNRRVEAGERQGDDCRKVGFMKVCRHTENVRLPLAREDVARIAASTSPIEIAFNGMTREPTIVKLDPAELRLLQSRIAGQPSQ